MDIVLVPSGVVFDAEEHRYSLNGEELKGITSTLLHTAFPDNYKGVSAEILDHAATRGTAVHQALQNNFTHCFVPPVMKPIVEAAAKLMAEKQLTPIEFEYLITDREEFASAIDIVAIDFAGNIVIIDTKTTSVLNYDYVAYQTAIYERMFKMQNPHLHVSSHYVLYLSVDDNYNFRSAPSLERLPDVDDNALDALLVAYHNDLPFDIHAGYAEFPRKAKDVSKEVVRLIEQQQQTDEQIERLKSGLFDLMNHYHIKRFSNDLISLAVVPATVSTRLDSRKLKKDHPEIAAKYMTSAARKAYLKITLKDNNE